MYKVITTDSPYGEPQTFVIRDNGNGSFTSFSADPANTDYQTFKKEVLAGAELQDADGNVMTQEQANAFIASLP
jgi:hypothetical protein